MSDLQRDVHRDALLHIQINRYGDCLLETGMLHRNRVAAHAKRTGHVLARIVGRGLQMNAALHIGHGDLGIGHNGAGLIDDRADDAAGVLLGKCRHR